MYTDPCVEIENFLFFQSTCIFCAYVWQLQK